MPEDSGAAVGGGLHDGSRAAATSTADTHGQLAVEKRLPQADAHSGQAWTSQSSVGVVTAAVARIQAVRCASVARRRYRAQREAAVGRGGTPVTSASGGNTVKNTAEGPLSAGPLDSRLARAAARIQAARRGSVVRRQFPDIRRTAAGSVGGAAGGAGAANSGVPPNRLSYLSPGGWRLFVDDDGDEFYYNAHTLASQRRVPADYKYISPAGWTEYVDEEGFDRFYYNVTRRR